MTQTLELVRPEDYIRAADLLEEADRVLCMGQGGSMIIAMEAAHLFSTASGKFISVTDSHMQTIAIATAGENDVILFFSYSGATKDLIQTISYARERGLRSILVTHFANSPGADLADVTLLCGANRAARLRRREDRADVSYGRALFRALPPQSGRVPPKPRPHCRCTCGKAPVTG